MYLLINELSIHEQFGSISEFSTALKRVLNMRDIATRLGRDVHCKHDALDRQPMKCVKLRQAVSSLQSKEQVMRAFSLFAKSGPIWEGVLDVHGSVDRWEYRGENVGQTGVGDAAYRTYLSERCDLISFIPSNWSDALIEVKLNEEDGNEQPVVVLKNWCDEQGFLEYLKGELPVLTTWQELHVRCKNLHGDIVLADNCFERMNVPFANGAANRIIGILDILNKLAGVMNDKGKSNSNEAKNALESLKRDSRFSDSSESEKAKFGDKLTFRHPEQEGNELSCTWHGKVSYQQIRVHFSLPEKSGEKVYVVYVGPKLTKK